LSHSQNHDRNPQGVDGQNHGNGANAQAKAAHTKQGKLKPTTSITGILRLKSAVESDIEFQMTETNTPPKVPPRLKAAPKIRNMYWCDFPEDAQLPEFWKRRPVIVVSRKRTLHGAITVIPCSTQPQDGNPWAVKLNTSIDGRDSWAICDKPCTVAVSRLLPHSGAVPTLPQEEFVLVLGKLLEWLPSIPTEKT
jgi:mRNA interferase MazF